ncbi:MAG: hypothetical protein GX667_09740 [Xanthomonadaceae bacterium]|nr:hypothetical protein [Xanthomonadaceae bacterium]
MKNKNILITSLILLAISFILGFYFGENIPVAQQLSQYDRLQNISAIVITIIGIWIAVIYPYYLKNLQTRRDGKNFINFEELIFPIKSSILILIAILLIRLIIPYLFSLDLSLKIRIIFRSLSYSTLIFFTLIQCLTLLATFLPIHSIYKYSLREKKNNDLNAKQIKEYDDSKK